MILMENRNRYKWFKCRYDLAMTSLNMLVDPTSGEYSSTERSTDTQDKKLRVATPCFVITFPGTRQM